jgi:uncharacterized protein YyaL (SSP411 family)
LIRLYLLTSELKWKVSTDKWFQVFSDTIEKNPSAYTFALCAFDFYIGPSIRIVLEGVKDDATLAHMRRIVYKHFIPNKSLAYRLNSSLATAYVCQGSVCQKPIQEIKELEFQLLGK